MFILRNALIAINISLWIILSVFASDRHIIMWSPLFLGKKCNDLCLKLKVPSTLNYSSYILRYIFDSGEKGQGSSKKCRHRRICSIFIRFMYQFKYAAQSQGALKSLLDRIIKVTTAVTYDSRYNTVYHSLRRYTQHGTGRKPQFTGWSTIQESAVHLWKTT